MFPVCWQCSCVVHDTTSFSRLHILQVHKQLAGFCLCQGQSLHVGDMRWAGALSQSMVTGVGEIVAVDISTVGVRDGF